LRAAEPFFAHVETARGGGEIAGHAVAAFVVEMVEWIGLRGAIRRDRRCGATAIARRSFCEWRCSGGFCPRAARRGALVSAALVASLVRIRAVVFDIYNTLLEAGPPPSDADARWESLWREMFASSPSASLAEFANRCDAIISREHAAARRIGVHFPEIFWTAVAAEALPELAGLSRSEAEEFLFRHARMMRTVRLMPGAAVTLTTLHAAGITLGIASNAQPGTLRELDAALADSDVTRAIFSPPLCFLSFEHGFSKPDPHVFRIVTARLRALGIAARETLMVGDRLDNDIEPASAQGFQTWHLRFDECGESSGDWTMLRHKLEAEA
jgi:putative hydrolase of the HAD superfamily